MVDKSELRVGVLSLQGGFEAHLEALRHFEFVNSKKVSSSKDLKDIDCLIIPGGESSVFLKLIDNDLKKSLVESGLPIFGTCAGLILLAKSVLKPNQDSLGLIDIDVERNAYGRQLDSFESSELVWSKTKEKADFIGVFIRAPKITRVGPEVEVLLEERGQPVLVKQGKYFAASFHPELNKKDQSVHRLFIDAVIPAR